MKEIKYKPQTSGPHTNGLNKDGSRIRIYPQPRCKFCKKFIKISQGGKGRGDGLLLCPDCKKKYKNKQRKIYNSNPQVKERRNRYQNKYRKRKYKEDPNFRKKIKEHNKKWLKTEKGKECNRKMVKRHYYKNIEYSRLYNRTIAYVRYHINDLKVGDVF